MVDPTLLLPGLSPIEGKEIVARFDGGRLSSDGGLFVLREIEQRLKVADRLAACIDDPRDPASTVHTVADIIRFRMLMIAAGYEDGNDATGLRTDPLFKLALERVPSDRDLCSQSTISRLENLPDARTLLRLAGSGRRLVGSFCEVPRRSRWISTTPSTRRCASSCRLHAHLRRVRLQPIVASMARAASSRRAPAKRLKGVEIAPFCAAWRGRSAAIGPRSSLLRADSALRLPGGPRLVRATVSTHLGCAEQHARRHITAGEVHRGALRGRAERRQVRRFKEFFDAARTWSRVRRIVARRGRRDGTDSRFIVTNLGHGNAVRVSGLYCRRGQAENDSRPGNPSRRRPHSRPKPPPISSGCSCTPAPIGCCGVPRRRRRRPRPGASPSSTRCGCA